MKARPSSRRGSLAAGVMALATALASALVALTPAHATAQDNTLFGSRSSADFLFGAPRITIGARGGYVMPSEGGDVLDDVRGTLTLDRGDFATGAIGVELGIRLNERWDLALGFESSYASERTEYRDFVGADDLPILQETSLARRPLTASLKYYLRDRGREISRLAWVPNSWVPFVGVGAGMMNYRFEIDGEFIDFTQDPPPIFETFVPADGWTGVYQALGGMNVSLTHRLFLTLEGRYLWADADPGEYFDEFESIDLSGASMVLGVSARF